MDGPTPASISTVQSGPGLLENQVSFEPGLQVSNE
jgi:hypothetical protein